MTSLESIMLMLAIIAAVATLGWVERDFAYRRERSASVSWRRSYDWVLSNASVTPDYADGEGI